MIFAIFVAEQPEKHSTNNLGIKLVGLSGLKSLRYEETTKEKLGPYEKS